MITFYNDIPDIVHCSCFQIAKKEDGKHDILLRELELTSLRFAGARSPHCTTQEVIRLEILILTLITDDVTLIEEKMDIFSRE